MSHGKISLGITGTEATEEKINRIVSISDRHWKDDFAEYMILLRQVNEAKKKAAAFLEEHEDLHCILEFMAEAQSALCS